MSAIVQNIKQKYDNNIDGFKSHLSKHYYFYKTLSASLIVAGALLSFELIGRTWPKMDQVVFDPFWESIVGFKVSLFYEKLFEFSDHIFKLCNGIADLFLNAKPSLYVIKGFNLLAGSGLYTTAAAVFLLINAPTIISYSSFVIGVYALPILPGAVIAYAGKTLWNLTEKKQIINLK
jgi:hypothetical protein